MTDNYMLGKFNGTLLGGAIGDALGGPVEFMQERTIRRQFPQGVTRFLGKGKDWPAGTVTDDTQMTLFSCEAILDARAYNDNAEEMLRESAWLAYKRWHFTQMMHGGRSKQYRKQGLVGIESLYTLRAPGNTCMGALSAGKSLPSSGCGGVMRAAPFGLQLKKTPRQCFRDAAFAAALTHGNPSGYLPAGALACIIRCLLDEMTVTRAAYQALRILRDWKGSEETQRHIRIAIGLAESAQPGTPFGKLQKWISVIGLGWTGEEALGIALYAVLAGLRSDGHDVLTALSLAVTHGGDSDSTGSIAGNILGAYFGAGLLPRDLVEQVEYRDLLIEMARRLHFKSEQGVSPGLDLTPTIALMENSA